tara:strand:- start:1824 stop:2513 length:690 start_codon:yes stop_codon:yes gene_type:complete
MKLITTELIETKLKERGIDREVDEHNSMLDVVQNYFSVTLTTTYGSPDFAFGEESSADGHPLYLARHTTSKHIENICDEVFVYEDALDAPLVQAFIDAGAGSEIYVECMEANFIAVAIHELYVDVAERLELEIKQNLLLSGWVEEVQPTSPAKLLECLAQRFHEKWIEGNFRLVIGNTNPEQPESSIQDLAQLLRGISKDKAFFCAATRALYGFKIVLIQNGSMVLQSI